MTRLRTKLDFSASKRSTKRSITIADHKTSISLENEFWDCLKEIAVERDVSLGALVAAIDANRQRANLSSAIRIFVLGFVERRFACVGLLGWWRRRQQRAR
jgi:predicted DNA-binding ribbon-helix-helix protein